MPLDGNTATRDADAPFGAHGAARRGCGYALLDLCHIPPPMRRTGTAQSAESPLALLEGSQVMTESTLHALCRWGDAIDFASIGQ